VTKATARRMTPRIARMSGRLVPGWLVSDDSSVSVGGAVGTCVSASGGTGTKTSDVSELGSV
jgi:hypothetical protein